MARRGQGGTQAPGSPWAAILEAVREQLPSLDSDSSLSDFGDEEPFIFQRDHAALIPDLSEELAEGPAGAAGGSPEACARQPAAAPAELASEPRRQWGAGPGGLPEGGQPDGPPGSCGGAGPLLRLPEQTPTWQEGDVGGPSLSAEGSRSPPRGPQGEAARRPLGGDWKTVPPRPASQAPDGSDPAGRSVPAGRRALRRERRRLIERDILHRVTRAAGDPACGDPRAAAAGPRPAAPPEGPREGPLVLSLQPLEDWHLDQLLQSLRGERGDRAPGATWRADHGFRGPGRAEQSAQDRLLGRLALLCAAQPRAPTAPRKAPAHPALDAGSRCCPPGPGPARAGGRRPGSSAEPSTVFIDLRPREPAAQGSGQSASTRGGSSSCSDEDEDEDEEAAALPEPASPSSQGLRHCSGKSQLLQQLRAFRMGTRPPRPAGRGPRGQKTQAPEEPAGAGAARQRQGPLSVEGQGAAARSPGASPGSEAAGPTLAPPGGLLQRPPAPS